MLTTRWADDKTRTLDGALELLLRNPSDDMAGKTTTCQNWNVRKMFDKNRTIKLNGHDISYNQIRYTYDLVTAGDQPIEDRTVTKDGTIIAYFNGTTVNYIINRNSDAPRLLRKMLGYSGKSEIINNTSPISSDLFVWMITKVYNADGVIEAESDQLNNVTIDIIKAIKGDTDDLLTQVTASGESVMNIISTLSFLLESRNLNQIRLCIQYAKHENIELSLSNKQTITAVPSEYLGELDDEKDDNVLLSELLLITYIEIMPIINQAYLSDIENGLWDNNAYVEFLTKVAEDLSNKVKARVEFLKNPNANH